MESPRFENQSDCERHIIALEEQISKLQSEVERLKLDTKRCCDCGYDLQKGRSPSYQALKAENEKARKLLDSIAYDVEDIRSFLEGR